MINSAQLHLTKLQNSKKQLVILSSSVSSMIKALVGFPANLVLATGKEVNAMMGVFITFKNCIASAGSEECISDFSVAPVQSELDAALTKIAELILASWCALLSPVLTEKADQDLLATWDRDVRGKKRTVLMVNQAVDDSKLLSTSSLPAIVQMNTVAAQTRHMFSLLASCSKLVSDPVVGRWGRGVG